MMHECFGSSEVLPGERECMALIAGSILTGSALQINYLGIGNLCLAPRIDLRLSLDNRFRNSHVEH